MSALTDFAQALAIYLHDGQVDKQGEPYRNHLAFVVLKVMEKTNDEEVIAAAWLHDSVEDHKVRLETLESLLPPRVCLLVDLLTRPEYESYECYIDTLCHPRVFDLKQVDCLNIRLIKIADLKHNLDPTRGPIKDSLRQRYEKALKKLEEADR